ncbi:hypothetical protein CCUS01_15540 [Colletotrichum cuscutae]|uniref:Uncharacterized protein n=1 Tax=Colletotrichum cuscutae TaxID=1209917 RepID=A0AAI9VDP6_9PEZI|nr:hypothetical protein CCUS01_15540 [Colletotrichum cuscutae]
MSEMREPPNPLPTTLLTLLEQALITWPSYFPPVVIPRASDAHWGPDAAAHRYAPGGDSAHPGSDNEHFSVEKMHLARDDGLTDDGTAIALFILQIHFEYHGRGSGALSWTFAFVNVWGRFFDRLGTHLISSLSEDFDMVLTRVLDAITAIRES